MTVSRSTVSQSVSRQAPLFRPKPSVNIDCLVMASLVVDILVLAILSKGHVSCSEKRRQLRRPRTIQEASAGFKRCSSKCF